LAVFFGQLLLFQIEIGDGYKCFLRPWEEPVD
jgi:hypothetical protein